MKLHVALFVLALGMLNSCAPFDPSWKPDAKPSQDDRWNWHPSHLN
ncbi:MAG: hypothetical protein U1F71_04895 [Verrucomicrobiaceae bacterium]